VFERWNDSLSLSLIRRDETSSLDWNVCSANNKADSKRSSFTIGWFPRRVLHRVNWKSYSIRKGFFRENISNNRVVKILAYSILPSHFPLQTGLGNVHIATCTDKRMRRSGSRRRDILPSRLTREGGVFSLRTLRHFGTFPGNSWI